MRKPNIVVFFSDQQRFDSVGVNGQPLPVTPRLDRMAAEGVNFTRAYTNQPVCGPARALLQTGLYASQAGCWTNGFPLPLDARSLARRMADAGYATGYVGKWHLASDSRAGAFWVSQPVPPERRGGYDYWVASDVLECTSHGYGGYLFDRDGQKREFTGYRTDAVTDYALDFIHDQASGEKPFFLFLSHIEPHHQNDRDRFEGPIGSREKFRNFVPPPDLPPGLGDWEKQMPDYLGCCHALDANLGRVLDCLAAKGILDDTLVVYTTDHGCHFQTLKPQVGPGGFDDYKRTCFENTIHIPMILRGPGYMGGRADRRLASLIDIPKTIAEAAGADASGMQGRGLAHDGAGAPEQVYIEISEGMLGRAIRTDRHTYAVHAPDKNPWNDASSPVYVERYLFDNEADPAQKRNLVSDPASAPILADMRQRLAAEAAKAGETGFRIDPAQP